MTSQDVTKQCSKMDTSYSAGQDEGEGDRGKRRTWGEDIFVATSTRSNQSFSAFTPRYGCRRSRAVLVKI